MKTARGARALSVGALLALSIGISGCALEKSSEPAAGGVSVETEPTKTEPSTPKAAKTEPSPQVRVAPNNCEWSAPRLGNGAAAAPGGQAGELSAVLVGAWQHTHTDSGSGFEPLEGTTDIRFVFPSATELLYCQDIKGVLEEQENRAALTLAGNELGLPAPATGYTAVAWDENRMVWINKRTGKERYLLQRR